MRLTLLICLCFLFACTSPKSECPCENLIESNGLLYETSISKDGKKTKMETNFTGTCFDENEYRKVEKKITEGIIDYEKSIHYFDSLTILGQEEKYKDGRKIEKRWFTNGQLYIENHWQDSLRHGTKKVWLSNGQPWVEGNYKNDERDGEYKLWHPNGNIRIKGYYSNGNPVGHWQYFYTNENLMCETDFENGKIIKQKTFPIGDSDSLSIKHYPSGDIEWIINYRNGMLHKTSTRWADNGIKTSEITYKNGKTDGHFIMWKYNTNDLFSKFLGYGDTTIFTPYVNGAKHGIERYYGANGKVDELKYIDGELIKKE